MPSGTLQPPASPLPPWRDANPQPAPGFDPPDTLKPMKTLDPIRQSLAPAEPWHTPLYLAQVFTYHIAKRITGDFREVTQWGEHRRPPHCLRLRRAYRSPAAQAFRDTVAREAREARNARA